MILHSGEWCFHGVNIEWVCVCVCVCVVFALRWIGCHVLARVQGRPPFAVKNTNT